MGNKEALEFHEFVGRVKFGFLIFHHCSFSLTHFRANLRFSVFKGYRNSTLVFHYAFHWAHALGNKLLDMARHSLETLQHNHCIVFFLMPESSLFIFAQLCESYWFIRTLESYADSSFLVLSVITLKIWFLGSISSRCLV